MMLTLAACSGDDETPDGMKNIAGENDAYNFYVPQSWVTNKGIVGAYYSTVDTSNVSITAYSGEEYTSSDDYWKGFKEDVVNISTEFEVVSENTPKVVAGRNAVQHTYKITVNGVKYQVQQTLVAYSNIMYVITYTAAEDRFDVHMDDVKLILDEFKFK